MKDEKFDRIQKAIDIAIRDAQNLEQISGYEIDGRVYNNYMSNEAFEEELREMKPEIREQFDDAPGGELKQKRGRYGVYPPKMASFGSSSRFIYKMLVDKGVSFEASLPTFVGHSANLDARKTADEASLEIFAEAKCHEIYGSHRNEVNEVYKPVFDKLQEFFTYTFEPSKKGYVKCSFKVMEQEILHFDLKQLICHFLGISAGLLEGAIKSKKIRFVYLIFNPHHIKDRICDKYRKKILDQYDKTIEEINLFDMEKLFGAIFEYQRSQNKKISHNYEGDIPEFEFFVADQSNGARYFE